MTYVSFLKSKLMQIGGDTQVAPYDHIRKIFGRLKMNETPFFVLITFCWP